MHEGPRRDMDPAREVLPDEAEIREIFDREIGERPSADRRKLEDEQGIYLWEVEVKGENGTTEYAYRRAGKFKQGASLETVIHVMYFDEDGMPEGGTSIAKYVDGAWHDTP